MRPIATTRRELFPHTTDDAVLEAHRPPRIGFSARTWYGVIAVMACTFMAILVAAWIASWTAPEAVHAAFGGTELQYSSKGRPQVFVGTWVERLQWGSLAAAFITYGLLRLSIQVGRGRDARVSWANYAAQRGLTRRDSVPASCAGLDIFSDGHSRKWAGVASGPLLGGAEVTVGATSWVTGSGKNRETHRICFAHVELPEPVAALFPGTALTRFLRGITNVDLHPFSWEELRFESTTLDDACEIRVARDPEDVRWRELFDPITLAGLAELYDGQWHQRGRSLVMCAGGNHLDNVPVRTLDGLCLTAAFMYRRMLAAASGDVARSELDAA